MSGPLPELLEAYGTRDYHMRKQAGIVGDLSSMWANRIMYGKAGTPMLSAATQLATELAPPAAFLGFMHRANRQDAELMAEARMMNQQFQEEEHARMAGTISAFGGGSGGYPGVAWDGEQKLSGVLNPEAEQVAVRLGRAMAHEYVKLAGLKEAGIFSTMAGWATKKLPSLAGKAATTAVQAPVAAAAAAPAGLVSRGVGALRNMWQGGAARMGGGGKPFQIMKPMTKLKVLGAGAGIAAGAGLYSAGKSAKQYMMIPTAQEHQGGHGPAPRANISPYGY